MLIDSLTLSLAASAGTVFFLAVALAFVASIRRMLLVEPGALLSLAGLAALAAIAFLLVHRDTFSGGNLAIVPDSVEYAAGARSLLQVGEFSMEIEGRRFPPRYLPWFPLFGLSPAFLFGGDIGMAIHAVTAWSLLLVATAFCIGCRVSGAWGGMLAAAGLLILPGYRYYSREVMSEIPNAAVTLLACSLYLDLADRRGANGARAIAAGVLVALAACFRPPSAFLCLPFVLTFLCKPRNVMAACAVVAPAALVGLASLRYNASVFGSPSRSGYNFWSPVPYDYPSMAFSAGYLPGNLGLLVYNTMAPAILLVLAFLFLQGAPQAQKLFESIDRTALERLARFTMLGTFPVVLLYLPYFYPNTRFYFVFEVLTVVCCGATMGAFMRMQGFPRWMGAGWLLAVLAVMLARPGLYGGGPPLRRLAAERIRAEVPEGAMVISGLDPVYLGEVAGEGRRFVPISRRVEYASKLIAWRKVEDPRPPPGSWSDHRAPGLKQGGAGEAVELVATETQGVDRIFAALENDVPAFLEASAITLEEMEVIGQTFALEPVAEDLYKLSLPPSILEE